MDPQPEDKPRKRAPGGGRKPKFDNPAKWAVSGSAEQKAKFYRLGGSAWLQKAIDAAQEPNCPKSDC